MGCASSTAYPPPPEPENKPLTALEIAAQKKKEAAAAEMAAINAKIASSPQTYQKEKTFKRKFEKRGVVGERHQKPKRYVADSASSHVSPEEAARIKSSVASKMAAGSLSRSLTRKSRRTGSGAEEGGDDPTRSTTRFTRAANAMRATSRLTRHTTRQTTGATERTTHHHHTGVLGAMEDAVDRMTHVMAIGFLGRIRHRARTSYDDEEPDVPEEVLRARASDGVHELEPAPEAAPASAPAEDEAVEEGDRVSA